MTTPECRHRYLRAWAFVADGSPAGMWSCADCGLRFAPDESHGLGHPRMTVEFGQQAAEATAMTTLDELTQKARAAQFHALVNERRSNPEGMRAAVLAVLAEVRAMVPDELGEMPDDTPMPGRAFTAGHNGCRAEMLRRLDQITGGK